jgi:hypothetical protein
LLACIYEEDFSHFWEKLKGSREREGAVVRVLFLLPFLFDFFNNNNNNNNKQKIKK